MDHSKDDSASIVEAQSETQIETDADNQVDAQVETNSEVAVEVSAPKKLDNHFEMILAAIKRSMDMASGEESKLSKKSDKKSLTALMEIKQGLVDEQALLAGFYHLISDKGDDSHEDESDNYSI